MFKGISTALITPFKKGDLDLEAFHKLLTLQVKEGITSFVMASTTGENPVLSEEEGRILCKEFEKFKKEVKKDLKLILATGSFSTKVSIEKTKKAQDLGANVALVVVPYYNKPPQKGLRIHFEKIASQSSLPVLLYNVPSRSACSLDFESTVHLSQIENIIGIKEASGDIPFFQELKKSCRKDFLFLSGDDGTSLEFFKEGGDGAISAAANILASELKEIFEAKGDKQEKLFQKIKPVIDELFKETNPIGAKQILSLEGVCEFEMRLPLVDIANPKLEKVWKKLGKSYV